MLEKKCVSSIPKRAYLFIKLSSCDEINILNTLPQKYFESHWYVSCEGLSDEASFAFNYNTKEIYLKILKMLVNTNFEYMYF